MPVPVGAPILLVLVGGYTLAAFAAIETTASVTETAIEQRDALWQQIYQHMAQYRLMVKGRFAVGAPLLLSLPILIPARGDTPAAANVSALWGGCSRP